MFSFLSANLKGVLPPRLGNLQYWRSLSVQRWTWCEHRTNDCLPFTIVDDLDVKYKMKGTVEWIQKQTDDWSLKETHAAHLTSHKLLFKNSLQASNFYKLMFEYSNCIRFFNRHYLRNYIHTDLDHFGLKNKTSL